jgi:hypothetical protein
LINAKWHCKVLRAVKHNNRLNDNSFKFWRFVQKNPILGLTPRICFDKICKLPLGTTTSKEKQHPHLENRIALIRTVQGTTQFF